MKKNSFIILSALIFTTQIFIACKKKDNTTAPSSTTNTTLTGFNFKVDGTLITADSANAVLYNNGGSREIDVYVFKGVIAGTSTANEVLEMHFRPKTGSQNVVANFSNAWLTYFANTTDYYDGSSGHFNITTCDTVNNKIAGTFDFIGTNTSSATKNITEGNIVVSKITKQ